MINKEQPGSLNATILFLWLTAAVIVPYESEGVYYALLGGNHVMHFRQSYPRCNNTSYVIGNQNYFSYATPASVIFQSLDLWLKMIFCFDKIK